MTTPTSDEVAGLIDAGAMELCKPYVTRNMPGGPMDGGAVTIKFRSDAEMEAVLALLSGQSLIADKESGEADDGWQTMDNAPRDGSNVDLWVAPVPDAPASFYEREHERRVANTYYSDYRWIGAEWPMMPTHWRRPPHPPAPEQIDAALQKAST